jgi:hypothetical protein
LGAIIVPFSWAVDGGGVGVWFIGVATFLGALLLPSDWGHKPPRQRPERQNDG